MRKPHWLWTTLALATLVAGGCDESEDGGNGNTGGDGGMTNGSTADGGSNGTSNGGNNGGGCDLSGEGKEKEVIPADGDRTLTSDKVWELKGNTYVADGETLTIEPCTRIEGQPASGSDSVGTLIVSRGGKIMAEGTADEPILFTSRLPEGSRAAGDWGGVILLGKAPNFKGDETLIEGLMDAPENRYGGSAPNDNSGVMKYVRIEFGGFELSMGNEVNGLTMGSVGSGTEIHHIMVNTTLDDCFEWFGGTVDAHHLICNGVGDDMFDADQGYQGQLEYLFGRLDTSTVSSGDPNGFEMDSDSAGTLTPVTTIDVKHATLCGGNDDISGGVSYGMVLRENVEGAIDDLVSTGFDFGVDTRDDFGTPGAPNVTLANAQFFGNRSEDVRGDESGDDDNDDGFSEDEWFEMGMDNTIPDPAPFTPADCLDPSGPTAAVVDSGAGAFSADADWNWDGLWISWNAN